MKTAISTLFLLVLSSTLPMTSLAQDASSPAASANANASAASEASVANVAAPTLIIKDLALGQGAQAEKGNTLEMHYTGWLYDANAKQGRGKQFDSSLKRGPLSFKLGEGRLIKGWEQGVSGMREGGKRSLIIPPELGYGMRNIQEGLIPPNSTLLFEVELVRVR